MNIKNHEVALNLFMILVTRAATSHYGYSEYCFPGSVITCFYKDGRSSFQVQKDTGPVTREIYFPTASEILDVISELAA